MDPNVGAHIPGYTFASVPCKQKLLGDFHYMGVCKDFKIISSRFISLVNDTISTGTHPSIIRFSTEEISFSRKRCHLHILKIYESCFRVPKGTASRFGWDLFSFKRPAGHRLLLWLSRFDCSQTPSQHAVDQTNRTLE